MQNVGSQSPRKNLGSHIDASHSRQPLVKGERLVRYEVNAVMVHAWMCVFQLSCPCHAHCWFNTRTLRWMHFTAAALRQSTVRRGRTASAKLSWIF